MIVLIVLLGGVVVVKEVARQNPEVQAWLNNSFLSSVLGSDSLPEYFKAAQINDNYHRCQNKLGFPLSAGTGAAQSSTPKTLNALYDEVGGKLQIYNVTPSRAKIAELEAPLQLMFSAGARFVFLDINAPAAGAEIQLADVASEYVKLAARNNIKPVFNLGKDFSQDPAVITSFITRIATKATESNEFIITAYPAYTGELSSVVQQKSDAVALSLSEFTNAIVTPPLMKMDYNPGCPGAGPVCVTFGQETTDPLSLFADMNIFRGTSDFNFDVYDMVMMGFDNYDRGFKNNDFGGVSRKSRLGYTHYADNVKQWITSYNDTTKDQKELQVLVVDYGPGTNTFVGDAPLLTERLGFDFGLFSDDPTIAGIVLSPELFNLESNISAEIYRKLNLFGTNCNYDLVSYGDEYSVRSTAASCSVKANANKIDESKKAQTRVVCQRNVDACEASIQYSVQVGLPIRHFGSNSGLGTDTQTTMPPSARAALQPAATDYLNQFAGELSSSSGTYTMPWLGNGINSSRVGIASMVKSLISYSYAKKESFGGFPKFAAQEQVAESTANPTFNSWTFNTSGEGKFNLRDEVSLCAGKDACINKVLVSQLNNFRDYNPTKQTFPTMLKAPVCAGQVQFLNTDPQNYIYGSEQIISEVSKTYNRKQLAYEVLLGTYTNTGIAAGTVAAPGCQCFETPTSTRPNGRFVNITASTIPKCSILSPDLINKCITVVASTLPYTYYDSKVIVEEQLPTAPKYEIPGIYDALAANYNFLQHTLGLRGEKIIFGQNIGWEADVQVKAYSVVKRDKTVEGEADYGITLPRKNNLLENFDHEAPVPLLDSYLGETLFEPKSTTNSSNTGSNNYTGNTCRVGVNLAIYAAGANDEVINKITTAGYQQALVITNGVAGEQAAVAEALNRLCAKGITPVLRSCITGTCGFSDGVSQANYLNQVINAASQCQSVYAICGHNEPESENLNGFVNEGQWAKACFDKLRGNGKIKITTPTFNATNPELEAQLEQFIQGYGGGTFAQDKSGYACLSANSYTYLDISTATASLERITNDTRFSGMPLCIFETGVTGNIDETGQNANVKNVVSELFTKYGNQLVMVLGFNWLDTNPDPAWDKFQLNDKNNADLAQCKFTGSSDGSTFFTIPGKYFTQYDNHLAEGTNWRTDKQYYQWLGALDEIDRLTDVYANVTIADRNLDSAIRNIPKLCTTLDVQALKDGKQLNCFAPSVSNPQLPGYIEDPLGAFLCSQGYEVVGTDCSKACKPDPYAGSTTTATTGGGAASTQRITGSCPIKMDSCWQGPAGNATHYCANPDNEPGYDFYPSKGDTKIYAPEDGQIIFADGFETPVCKDITKATLISSNTERSFGDSTVILSYINSLSDFSAFQSSGGYIGYLGKSGTYYRLRHIDINKTEAKAILASKPQFKVGEVLTAGSRPIELYFTPGPETPAGPNGSDPRANAVYTPCWRGAHLHTWAKVEVDSASDPAGFSTGKFVDPYSLFGDVLGCSSARTCANDYKCELPGFVQPYGVKQITCTIGTPGADKNFSSIEALALAVAQSISKGMNTPYPAGMILGTMKVETSFVDENGKKYNGDPLQTGLVKENSDRVSGPMQFMDSTFMGIITTNRVAMQMCLSDIGVKDLPYELSMRNYVGPAMCAAAIKHIANAKSNTGGTFDKLIQEPDDWYEPYFYSYSGAYFEYDVIDYTMSAIHVAARKYYGACIYRIGTVSGDYCKNVYNAALSFRDIK